MPSNVRRFEILMYFAAAVAIAKSFWLSPEIDVRLFVSMGWMICVLALVWLAAYGRKNWARWILFGLFLIETLLKLTTARELIDFPVQLGLYFSVTAIEALAYWFAFTGNASAWFRK